MSRLVSDTNRASSDWIGYLLVGRVAGVNDSEILHELTPVAEALLERHLATTKEWFPHDYVPYGRGRDHEPGAQWSPDDADLAGHEIGPEVRSALLVNLLTEDNLPYYFRRSSSCSARTAHGAPGYADGPPRRVATRWRSTAI